jgi:nitrile hydratase subunit beta
MDGIHDMGGMDGFGDIHIEQNEPPFHEAWEGRVMALQRAMSFAGAWNIDHARYAQERIRPDIYLAASYYQKWALAMETNVVERGLAGADELQAGHALRHGKALPRKFTADLIPEKLTRGTFYREPQAPARFKIGDHVRTKNIHPRAHTRLPRYAREKVGVIERCQGCHMYPDSVASNLGDNPQWLYTVVFDGRELWGPDGDSNLKVSIEAFEPYLEAV